MAVDGNEVVGTVWGFEDNGFYVDRLHVAPNRKGRGIGSALLKAIERLLPPNGRLWLDVLQGNDPAMKFYERVGFTRCGETDACGGLAGIPAVIFEKTVKRTPPGFDA